MKRGLACYLYVLVFDYIYKLKSCDLNNDTYLLTTSKDTSPTILTPTVRNLVSTYKFSY